MLRVDVISVRFERRFTVHNNNDNNNNNDDTGDYIYQIRDTSIN